MAHLLLNYRGTGSILCELLNREESRKDLGEICQLRGGLSWTDCQIPA